MKRKCVNCVVISFKISIFALVNTTLKVTGLVYSSCD